MNLKLTHNSKYANFLPRLAAEMIDNLIFTIPGMIALVQVAGKSSVEEVIVSFIIYVIAIALPAGFLTILYKVLPLVRWGKTLGKAIAGLEVANEKKEFLNWKWAFFREFMAKPVSGALFGAGFFAVLFDMNHQAWHDQLAGTFVYKKEDRGMISFFILLALLLVYGYLTYALVTTALGNTGVINEFKTLMAS